MSTILRCSISFKTGQFLSTTFLRFCQFCHLIANFFFKLKKLNTIKSSKCVMLVLLILNESYQSFLHSKLLLTATLLEPFYICFASEWKLCLFHILFLFFFFLSFFRCLFFFSLLHHFDPDSFTNSFYIKVFKKYYPCPFLLPSAYFHLPLFLFNLHHFHPLLLHKFILHQSI